MCTAREMDYHGSYFQDQALFNFDSSCAKLRKAGSASTGRTTRSILTNLDAGLSEDIIEALNYK